MEYLSCLKCGELNGQGTPFWKMPYTFWWRYMPGSLEDSTSYVAVCQKCAPTQEDRRRILIPEHEAAVARAVADRERYMREDREHFARHHRKWWELW